jgi:hypothetical protein
MILANSAMDSRPWTSLDIGDGAVHRPTYVNRNLTSDQKENVCMLLKGSVGCFAWEYT